MPLFQNSVLKKYLAGQDYAAMHAAFGAYLTYFHDPMRRANIRASKEEQFQEGFLRELFVNILGYTINPDPDFNLTTELKNIKDSKKTDGAIIKDGKAIAVIELKGTDTKDLEKIRDQAFNYKNNHPDCIYVITSNFEKLRFYIHNAVDYIEFSILQMQQEEFRLLWLLLQKDNLLKGIPQQIKTESLLVEEQVTKKLYSDYSAFKQELWQDTVANNPGLDELLLYKKSQKLLDRFLFIFFAEDKGLLPPNSISEIVKQWDKLAEMDEYRPLYDRFKKYFGYMNTGRALPGKAEIHAYNGGLFAPDELLDSLTISDALLKKHVSKLTEYDFESEVDTNILGHIFEHSLNDIENVRASLEGTQVDKSKTKRKKDGVFYTPKYITKYIVDNTVGKLCTEKKTELGIVDEDFAKGKAGRKKDTLQKLVTQLKAYREWLLQLAICDPACGSGAFLNQVLEFLMAEHRYLDELESMLFESSIVFPNVENHILENNIFGVDINEESVEIARLSLWLRTAQKGRKLSTLSSNIKVGNSLIDDPEVAGDLAFDWQAQFPKVFAKGGFDVVVGNPPYVRAELLSEFRSYFSKHFKVFDPASDLFAYFYELGSNLINPNTGLMGFISNTFDKTSAGIVLRKYLKENSRIFTYVDFTEVQVFDGATTYPVIILLDKKIVIDNQFPFTKIPQSSQAKAIDIALHKNVIVPQNSLKNSSWSFLPKENVGLFQKLNSFKSVREKYGKCYYGVKTALNEAFIIEANWPISHHVKMIYEGKEIKKWKTPDPQQKLILFPSGWTKIKYGTYIQEDDALSLLKKDFPEIINHLMPFEEGGKKRYDKGDFWWELRNCAYYDLFEQPKIIFPNLQNKNKFSLDTEGVFVNAPAVFLQTSSKTLLCVLNSKLVWEFLKSICVVRSGGYIEVKPQYFEQIPIPEFKNEEQFESKADMIIEATKNLQSSTSRFLGLLQSKFHIEKPSTKLQNWPDLDFKGFLGELAKAKVKLSLSEEAEWMAYFHEQKAKAQSLQSDITRLDREVDALVYELYGLTEEEINIIENNKI
ncbi:BREX-1 system adenine-specific DNA-methyltransferase PglX [Aquiflexum sp. TKW24L]|uniref:Eco57I restriction-modification methylase domain-containing protein n=1 Tax=Aquiflexum sp. TKW24L TaxID=2942212 RepID=UPI0020C16B86|nr:DNA methyltransferase [Aquiflexum sp. TKW24L]MCL6259162.1 BREX-1 system adenine-specific DNA-methyltransferase PglX [Aquiflexum sp. TKW24L]